MNFGKTTQHMNSLMAELKVNASALVDARARLVEVTSNLLNTYFDGDTSKAVYLHAGIPIDIISELPEVKRGRTSKKLKAPVLRPVKKGKATKRKPLKPNNENALKGRQAVARGERPVLKDAIATVMGKDTLTSSEIVARLDDRGWLPQSKNPQQYISYTLSANKDLFEAVARGHYQVVSKTPPEATKKTS